MAPQQHLVISWVLANLNYERKRDRVVAVLAGVLPDIDGLGAVVDYINKDPYYYNYLKWHRTFGHSIFTLLFIMVVTFLICGRRIRPVIVASSVWLTHMFFDLTGSAGPDGSIWTLIPFWPLSEHEISFSWQWALNGWQNVAITAVFVIIMIIIATKKKRSLIEIFSSKFDSYAINVVEQLLRRRKANS